MMIMQACTLWTHFEHISSCLLICNKKQQYSAVFVHVFHALLFLSANWKQWHYGNLAIALVTAGLLFRTFMGAAVSQCGNKIHCFVLSVYNFIVSWRVYIEITIIRYISFYIVTITILK